MELTAEAALLPKTLAEMRKAIEDLRSVSSRLERATKGIEVLLEQAERSGVAPLARQLNAAAADIDQQMREVRERLPGGQMVNQAVDDLQKSFDMFTALLPKPKERPKPE